VAEEPFFDRRKERIMSTADLLGPSPTKSTDDTLKHLHRIAGLGGVGAFLAWLGQPILVFLITGPQGDAGGDWSDVESSRYNGALEVLIFSALGIGVLFLVLATWRIISLHDPTVSVAATVGHVLGLVAGVSWFLVAAEAFRMFTSIGAAIPEVTADSALQATMIHGTALDLTGALLLFVVGFSGWLVMMATAGRRAGVVGLPVAVVLMLFVLVQLVPLAVPFSPPWPLVGYILAMLILGISFLLRSRR
jgi:hypothetical protein